MRAISSVLKMMWSARVNPYTKSHHSFGRMLALHFRQWQTQKKPWRRSPYCCQFVHSWAQNPKSRRIMTGPTYAGRPQEETHIHPLSSRPTVEIGPWANKEIISVICITL